LIFSGQLTKAEAMQELNKPMYPEELFKTDYDFVLKKLGFTDQEFKNYIDTPPVHHNQYESGISIFDEIPIFKMLKKIIKKTPIA
jgi:hypothetical protein